MAIHDVSALPVTFKQKLRNVSIEEGNTATLRCELSKQGHTVEWRKGGIELIRNGEKYHVRQRDVLIELRISDVTPEDSNIYTCICGDIETTATLTVNGNAAQEQSLTSVYLTGKWSHMCQKRYHNETTYQDVQRTNSKNNLIWLYPIRSLK